MEIPRLAELGLYELHPMEEFGVDELHRIGALVRGDPRTSSCCAPSRRSGSRAPSCPRRSRSGSPTGCAPTGVELTVDQDFFDDRRRVKTDAELAGIRRAQRAAEAGDGRRARPAAPRQPRTARAGVDGEPLTVERVKAAMAQAFAAHGATADDFIVAPGAQGAVGHDMGSGPIRAGVPIVIDIWPRDNESFMFCDMTRTFVVGDVPDDVASGTACARRRSTARSPRSRTARRTGDLRRHVRDLRGGGRADAAHEGAGRAARRRLLPRARPRRRARGARGAGPGPGLEAPLQAGDVVTVEPGLYRQGYGGVRLEDLVLVTEDGAENLTQYPYDLAP